MTSDFLAKLGLRVVSAAAVGATTLALSAGAASAASAAPVAAQAAPHILHDYGTTLRNSAEFEMVVADNIQQNNNRPSRSVGAKPVELSNLA